MIVDLTKLENSQIEFDLSIGPDKIDFESEFVSGNRDVGFKGTLDNREHWTLVEGEINAQLDIACSRCLEKVETPVTLDFESAFITMANLTEENEIELEVQALDVSIFEGNKIDLAEVAREQILLALPAQVLCKDDCKGLCTECGANKNLKSCKCDESSVDSRWSALDKLKIDKDE